MKIGAMWKPEEGAKVSFVGSGTMSATALAAALAYCQIYRVSEVSVFLNPTRDRKSDKMPDWEIGVAIEKAPKQSGSVGPSAVGHPGSGEAAPAST